MKIKSIVGGDADDLANAIRAFINTSRFTANVLIEGARKKSINITEVRLRKKKPYCGNHPNSCELGGGGKDPKRVYLEGADWVEFNDRLNDIMDEKHISANARSAVCHIRRGTYRRVYYGSYKPSPWGNYQWEMLGDIVHDYEDHTGIVSEPSLFPEGTPGQYAEIYACVG
jgi:hypothetical protein